MTSPGEIVSSAGRGLVAAMAMSGVRELTRGAGFVNEPPPDEMASEGVPGLFRSVPSRYRDAAIEAAHWCFGAGMGAIYGTAPRRLRRRASFGVACGLAIWVAYEQGASRILGIDRSHATLSERVSVAADHVLFGLVIAHER